MKCADLSKSPVHTAAIGKLDPDRGISIRFPRLLRERLDKDPEQATTSDQASGSSLVSLALFALNVLCACDRGFSRAASSTFLKVGALFLRNPTNSA